MSCLSRADPSAGPLSECVNARFVVQFSLTNKTISGFEIGTFLPTIRGIANRCGRDAQLYLGDVIELFVRESRDLPRYFEFEWSPDQNDVFDARFDDRKFGPPGTSWNTDIQWAVHVNGSTDDATDQDAGWIVESAIPLSAFDPITVGSEWTFTVARYDYFNAAGRTEQLMMLTPGDPDLPRAGLASGFHTYELYDNLKFAPEPLNFGVILAAMVMFLLRRSVRGC